MTRDAHVASAAARVAGAVIALGYLLGLVQGPIVAVIGGLALVTLGRALSLDRPRALLECAALAVIAGAIGISGLRWTSLELSEIRGAQVVLGPTVLVDPPAAAVAAAVATGGALVGVALWQVAGAPAGSGPPGWLGWLEAAIAGFAIATAFWSPALVLGGEQATTEVLIDAAVGAAVVAAATLLSGALARLLRTRDPRWWWAATGVAVVAVLVALGIIGGTFA